ncbi:MAG: FtsX-like permease family protein [Myxococcales bacterium]|nr:FtsX-like permease family protein [Myxococcales bacterium]
MRGLLLKIVADLRHAPGRAGVLVAAVAVATACLGAMTVASAVLRREVPQSFLAAVPPHVVVTTAAPFHTAQLPDLSQVQGVAAVTTRRLVRGRVRSPDGSWRPLLLFVVEDFDDLPVSRVVPDTGAWPPPEGTLALERSALPVVGSADSLHVRAVGLDAHVRVSGTVHDGSVAPAWQDDNAPVFVTTRTARAWGLGAGLDEVRLLLHDDAVPAEVSAGVVGALRDSGIDVLRVEAPLRRHPHQDHVDALLALVSVFGAVALVLAALLTANLAASRVALHRREVAVMKSLGARSWQVAVVLLGFVALPAAIGVLLGVGPALALGRAFAGMAAEQLNLGDPSLAPPGSVVLAALSICWGVPVAAAGPPLWRAVRASVAEGLRPAVASARIRGWPRSPRAALALRSLLARPARVLGTVVCLAVGGAALMTTVNVQRSLEAVVQAEVAKRADDVEVRLQRPADPAAMVAVALGEGAASAAPWGLALASVVRADGTATSRVAVQSPPAGFAPPQVVRGRWLRSSEEAVVNRVLVSRHPEVALGRTLVLRAPAGRRRVRVVGVVDEVAPPGLYTGPAVVAALTGDAERMAAMRLVAGATEPSRLATAVEQALVQAGFFPLLVMDVRQLGNAIAEHLGILLAVLGALSLGSVAVGGLSLATMLSASVLERTREIGIVKAVGGTSGTVAGLVVAEGATVAGIAWVASVALMVPLSALVVRVLSEHGLNVTVPLVMDPTAPVVWAVALVLVGAVAVWLPARRAVRQPVHEGMRLE